MHLFCRFFVASSITLIGKYSYYIATLEEADFGGLRWTRRVETQSVRDVPRGSIAFCSTRPARRQSDGCPGNGLCTEGP